MSPLRSAVFYFAILFSNADTIFKMERCVARRGEHIDYDEVLFGGEFHFCLLSARAFGEL